MRPQPIEGVVLGVAILVSAFATTAQDPPPGSVDLQVQIGVRSVEFGAPFPVRVVRSWHRASDPEPWRDELLAPIVLGAAEVSFGTRDDPIIEARSFTGHLFELGAIEVPAAGLTIDVRSALDTTSAVAIELPDGPFPAPFPWLPWVMLTIIAGTIGGSLWWGGRRLARRRSARATPPGAIALARLAELRSRAIPIDPAGRRADAVAASDIARTYLSDRFELHARPQTSDEFLSDPRTQRALDARHRTALHRFLGHCDRLKFARGEQSAAERAAALATIEDLVQTTNDAGPGPRGADR